MGAAAPAGPSGTTLRFPGPRAEWLERANRRPTKTLSWNPGEMDYVHDVDKAQLQVALLLECADQIIAVQGPHINLFDRELLPRLGLVWQH